jgi:protein-disulfide isomerase
MKKNFEDSIDLDIYKNDSQEAKDFEIKSSTTVFVNGEGVPLDVALSNEKMNAYLKGRM